jgi:hypothetical protein
LTHVESFSMLLHMWWIKLNIKVDKAQCVSGDSST